MFFCRMHTFAVSTATSLLHIWVNQIYKCISPSSVKHKHIASSITGGLDYVESTSGVISVV